MNRWKTAITIPALIMLTACAAHDWRVLPGYPNVLVDLSNMSATDLIRLHDSGPRGKEVTVNALSGEFEGMGLVSAYVATHRGGGVFCPTGKTGLTGEQIYATFHDFAQSHQEFLKSPYGAVLIYALIDAFPCKAAH